MHNTIRKREDASLIAGVLVLLAIAGLCRLLWLYFHAPIFWVVIIAWIIVPLFPFVIRLFSLRLEPAKREVDGIC